jgi:hypothetical protein
VEFLYTSTAVPSGILRISSNVSRRRCGGDVREDRSIHRPTPKKMISEQGNNKKCHRRDIGFKSGNTPVSLPQIPPSFPNANERKKGDKSELKRL